MDFHSLLRRDLQFLCKRNKIPANMTNVAMADALKSLENVEGLDEYMNQSDANAPHSPTSVAKQPPNTASRTTRRKTALKAEPQSSSQLVNRSCHLTSKSLAEEMNQEPKTNNVKFESSVLKTPAARSTRKASAAISCSSKVQESKKNELVQSVYSTRRSTRLLEKCMADLSLKTTETLDNEPSKNEETEEKVSAQEKNPADSEEESEEPEVIPGRNLSTSMEKEWEILKNDSDHEVEDLEIHVDLNDIAAFDTNTETKEEDMNEVMDDEKAEKQEEEETTLQAEENLKKNENDQEIGESETEPEVDLNDIAVFDSSIETKNEDINELMDDEKAEQEEEETTLQAEESLKKIGESETVPEEDNSGIDLDDTISEAESNQAVLGSEIADEEMTLSETESSDTAPPTSPIVTESISVQFPRPNILTTTPLKNSDMKLDNNNKENNMEMMNVEEEKGEAKKVVIDEESLKSVSMRQLVKMVKELSIKNNSRKALAVLPDSNQISE